jgi:aspartate carbamoyltransferase catalytic subunit
MLDLFTIRQAHGRLDGLNVILAGDLRYGRTVHSLSHALTRFGCELIFASPELLRMPRDIVADLNAHGANITETEDLLSTIDTADVVYMTRIQKERFADEDEYTKVAGAYKLHASNLEGSKESMIIMHPLPRVDEIHPSVDDTRHARYFEQAFNGVVARMSLLCRLLNVEVPASIGGEA